jgi:histidine triad (HIT) family protein
MNTCTICRIISRELPSHIIQDNKGFVAFMDIGPINPGHLLLVPREHCDQVFDLEDTLFTRLFLEAKRVAGPLRDATNARRIAIAVEGFTIPHVHVHLVPVNSANELDPKRASRVAEGELATMAASIRNHFPNRGSQTASAAGGPHVNF